MVENRVFLKQIPRLLSFIRKSKGWNRSYLGMRLKVSPTIIYNWETGRTKMKLGQFIDFMRVSGFNPASLLANHMFSIQEEVVTKGSAIVLNYRKRLGLTQKELALKLGYSSASMIHHYEKGIREPTLIDFFNLMFLAEDNIQGLVLELIEDKNFADLFPEGAERIKQSWGEYWTHFYISAIRQLMRSTVYKKVERYKVGMFAQALGISIQQELKALEVLGSLDIVKWNGKKHEINSQIKIIIPHHVDRLAIDKLKKEWLEQAWIHYQKSGGDHALFSIDTLPCNSEIYHRIIDRIRDLQEEVHNIDLDDTTGCIYLGWQANFFSMNEGH